MKPAQPSLAAFQMPLVSSQNQGRKSEDPTEQAIVAVQQQKAFNRGRRASLSIVPSGLQIGAGMISNQENKPDKQI